MPSPAVQNPAQKMIEASPLKHPGLPAARWLDAHAKAPSTEGFIALLAAFRATGGTAPAATVARFLEEHPGGQAVSLAQRVFTKQLFGFDWRANFWIPMFQLRADDLALKVAPQRVRAALPSTWSGWTLACWFAAPHPQLDGGRPVDALTDDFDAVLRAASSRQFAAISSPSLGAPMWTGAPVWRERRASARV